MRWYFVSWDCNGVEYFRDITADHPDQWAERNLLTSIKQGKKVEEPLSVPVNALMLRARMNSQRHYEIYVFTSEDDVNEEDIREWFTSDPQGFADWVRVNHTQKLWGNRAPRKKPAIV